jgi:hypothetical protein
MTLETESPLQLFCKDRLQKSQIFHTLYDSHDHIYSVKKGLVKEPKTQTDSYTLVQEKMTTEEVQKFLNSPFYELSQKLTHLPLKETNILSPIAFFWDETESILYRFYPPYQGITLDDVFTEYDDLLRPDKLDINHSQKKKFTLQFAETIGIALDNLTTLGYTLPGFDDYHVLVAPIGHCYLHELDSVVERPISIEMVFEYFTQPPQQPNARVASFRGRDVLEAFEAWLGK